MHRKLEEKFNGTRYSRAVTHPCVSRAHRCLTWDSGSDFSRELLDLAFVSFEESYHFAISCSTRLSLKHLLLSSKTTPPQVLTTSKWHTSLKKKKTLSGRDSNPGHLTCKNQNVTTTPKRPVDRWGLTRLQYPISKCVIVQQRSSDREFDLAPRYQETFWYLTPGFEAI